jgi:hypothetical protein
MWKCENNKSITRGQRNGRERGGAAVPVCLLQGPPEVGVVQPSRREREEDVGWMRERSRPREREGRGARETAARGGRDRGRRKVRKQTRERDGGREREFPLSPEDGLVNGSYAK